jgi:magnesium transporter
VAARRASDLARMAADHATSRVPIAAPTDRVGDVRASLPGRQFDSADDVAVLEGERLVGIVSIERLLAADANAELGEVMASDRPTVLPGAPQAVAAWRMVRNGESSLAVVDEDHRFLGLIPPGRMIAVLLAEHDEDLARLGGYMASATRDRLAEEEPLMRRLRHRLPWLLLGLAGAMASAVLVGSFEEELDRKVLLAFFVPAVVYMADAVGTQTETLLIRGLSAGVRVRDVARGELLTGVVIGLIVATAFLPFALVAWGDERVAVAVALALLASCSVATIVAMTLPAIFQRLGRDPAFGSGPLATVLQDLASIAIYFAIAVPLAT